MIKETVPTHQVLSSTLFFLAHVKYSLIRMGYMKLVKGIGAFCLLENHFLCLIPTYCFAIKAFLNLDLVVCSWPESQ